jgi:predicted metalloendopeptidase
MKLFSALLLVGLLAVATIREAPPELKSGLDPASFDSSVRPQDDLYRFVNGRWLATTEIPADRVVYGAFTELTEQAEADLRAIIEETAASRPRRGSAKQQIADLYASVMNEAQVDALGATPLAPVLSRIAGVTSTSELAAAAGYLGFLGTGGPFATTVVTDAADVNRLIVQVTQGGTLLPTRDSYLSDEPRFVTIRTKYTAYLTTIFGLAGAADSARDAQRVLEIETALARCQLSPTDSREAARVPQVLTLRELTSKLPGFDWKAWARPQGVDQAAAVALLQPAFFVQFTALVPALPLEDWKAWLAARYLTAMAPYLSRPFVDARFDFFGRELTGQSEPRVRWKVGVALVNSMLGDALGRLYVEKHLPPQARARVETMVATLLKADRQSVDEAAWLAQSTRNEAAAKLSRLTARIGSPDRWRDYSGLEIKADDLAGNVQRARRFDSDYRMTRVSAAMPGEWLTTTPQTVNAYYNPALNEIVLPAAMLQPPLFDLGADDAVNYGALGATIGHELAHALDERGRRYDSRGEVRRWWTAADERAYAARVSQLVGQFGAYEPLANLPVNGELTLGENAGDLAGLSLALRAYRLALGGRPAPVIDGLPGEQRFFFAWARMWRMKVRPDYLREWVLKFPYAPYEYRANGAVRNLSAFHDAFGVKTNDKLFRSPAERVTIW